MGAVLKGAVDGGDGRRWKVAVEGGRGATNIPRDRGRAAISGNQWQTYLERSGIGHQLDALEIEVARQSVAISGNQWQSYLERSGIGHQLDALEIEVAQRRAAPRGGRDGVGAEQRAGA